MFDMLLNHIILLIVLIFRSTLTDPSDWDVVESLAEEYPYVIAILNSTLDYICTGTVIDARTVLTSGNCVNGNPYCLAMSAVLFDKNAFANNTIKIAYSSMHTDYILESHESEMDLPRMHNNVGIIVTIDAVLDKYFETAIIGYYFAPELKDKALFVVGYGRINKSKAIVLQSQIYHQMACVNPRWYYCTCGVEYLDYVTYEEPFGEGGPVLLNNEVVGISARPCGTLAFKTNVEYNIFTILAPYLPWIERTKIKSTHVRAKLTSSVDRIYKNDNLILMSILLITIINI